MLCYFEPLFHKAHAYFCGALKMYLINSRTIANLFFLNDISLSLLKEYLLRKSYGHCNIEIVSGSKDSARF